MLRKSDHIIKVLYDLKDFFVVMDNIVDDKAYILEFGIIPNQENGESH